MDLTHTLYLNDCSGELKLTKTQYMTKTTNNHTQYKQAPVVTGMSHTRNLRWDMLLHMNEAGTVY